MPDPTENLQRLKAVVEEWAPDQVVEEVERFTGSGIGQTGPLATLIAKHEFDLDPTPEAEADPLRGLVEAIGSAVDKVPAEDTRASLGNKLVNAFVGALGADEFRPTSYEAVKVRAEEASSFITFTDDPRRQAEMFTSISGAIMDVDVSGIVGDDSPSLLWHASAYLDKAAGRAENIEDAGNRASAFIRIAGQAAKNIVAADSLVPANSAEQELVARTRKQPVHLYEAAIEAAATLKDPVKEYVTRGNIIRDMVRSAGSIRQADSELYQELVDKAVGEIDELLATYTTGKLAKQNPADASHALIDFGAYLSMDLDVSKGYKDNHDLPRQQLVKHAVMILAAGRDKAQQAAAKPRLLKPRSERQSGGLSGSVLTAASRFWQSDRPEALGLLKTSFDIAVTEDGNASAEGRHTYGIIQEIARWASQQPDLDSALELHLLAHKLESSQLDEGETSEALNLNAETWLEYMGKVRHGEQLELDEAGQKFVEFAVQAQRVHSSVREITPGLEKLAQLTHNYPGILKLTLERVSTIRAAEDEERRPKSEADELIQELVRGK